MTRVAPKKKAVLYNHSQRQEVISRTFAISADGLRKKFRASSLRLIAPLPSRTSSQSGDAADPFVHAEEHDPLPAPTSDENEDIEVAGVRVVVKERSRRYESTTAPLRIWRDHRQEFMDETLRLDGRAWAAGCNTCPDCHGNSPIIRCTECTGGELTCSECAVKRHERLPLHIVEKWTGLFFQRVALRELGLVTRLVHQADEICSMGITRRMVVIHINGIHEVDVVFCHCRGQLELRQQLMRHKWWPATAIDPHTCATMEVLRTFHSLNLQGNITGTDFYRGLENLTDSRRLTKLPDRRVAFMHMVREWRNIKMLRRQGRGHDPAGVDATKLGELAVPCRACPHPGINLPPEWDRAPPEHSFLYFLILALDANFRQQGRFRGTSYEDVSLCPGWATFVEPVEYMNHVSKFATQEEVTTCAGFLVLMQANLKNAKGLSSTGVGGSGCARHEMWRPNGLGDLQRGERYCNMDYILLSSLVGFTLLWLVVSYDISCQFFQRFWTRVHGLPARLQPTFKPECLEKKIPKAHISYHGEKCHGRYAFNYMTGAGRTDGEGIERLWSWLNKAAPSAKEMTPCGRRETIDDFCGFANWRKTIGLGDLLLRRMLEAIKESSDHEREFEAFEASLKLERPEQLQRWEHMLAHWEKDKTKACPYVSKRSTMTIADIKLKLLLQEEQDTITGVSSSRASSATGFLLLGFDVENLQQALDTDVRTNTKLSTLSEATRSDKRNALRKKIKQLREMQAIHMPALHQHIQLADDVDDVRNSQTLGPELTPLYLPSHLSVELRQLICNTKLLEAEEQLREAQATEALEDLRRQLRARMFANKYKVKNVTGQRKNTRARQWQKTIDDKAIACKHRYRRARAALLALRGPGEWENVLRVLADSDVRSLNERALTEQEKLDRQVARKAGGLDGEEIDAVMLEGHVQVGEGRRSMSWIWYAVSTDADEDDPTMGEALRVEWAKARARARRWTEEVMLLAEEMRRAVAYSLWLADWWDVQATRRLEISKELEEGLHAYASQHAAAERALAALWESRWAAVRLCAAKHLNARGLSMPAGCLPPVPVDFHLPPSTPSSTPTELQPAAGPHVTIVEVELEVDDEDHEET